MPRSPGMTTATAPTRALPQKDDHLDLVPLIDCVFLILLFFMLVGRLSDDRRSEQITVPPSRTATSVKEPAEWSRELINVSSRRTADGATHTTLRLGNAGFTQVGDDDRSAYRKLRALLDRIHDRAGTYPDTKVAGRLLPKVVIEVRADADTEYRVVQEVQQVLTDTLPAHGDADAQRDPQHRKPFVDLAFTTRDATARSQP